MGKTDSIAICNFILNHYDHVSQDEWFEFSEFLLNIAMRDANKRGYAAQLAKEFPMFFGLEGE